MTTKKLIEDFLHANEKNVINSSYLSRDEVEEFEEEIGKELVNFNSDDFLVMFSKFRINEEPILDSDQVSKIRNKYNDFFKWCVKHGYIKENPFTLYKEELTDKAILEYLISCNGDELVLYKPEEIEEMCKRLLLIDDGIYFEGIIRTLYEGLPNTKTFVEMKESYINWETNVVDFGYMKFKISDRLKFIYKKVNNMEEIRLKGKSNTRRYPLKKFNGSLYKFPIKNKKKWEDINDVDVNINVVVKGINSNRFAFLENYLECKLSADILYKSWILKVLLENCNNDIEIVKDLILSKNSKTKCKIIDGFFENISHKIWDGNKIRRQLRPYFLKK